MQAADLIALVSGKGIDLGHVAGNASNLEGAARKRRRLPIEIKLGVDVMVSVRGHGSRAYRRAVWSLAELGIAGQDVPRIPWLAAMYSYGRDQTAYWHLWEALADAAQDLGRRNKWAPRVRDVTGKPQYYRERLAEMVLDADRYQPVFAASPAVFAIYLNVTDEVWERVLSERFDQLKHRYHRWLAVAQSEINRKIRANTDRYFAEEAEAEAQVESHPGAESERLVLAPHEDETATT